MIFFETVIIALKCYTAATLQPIRDSPELLWTVHLGSPTVTLCFQSLILVWVGEDYDYDVKILDDEPDQAYKSMCKFSCWAERNDPRQTPVLSPLELHYSSILIKCHARKGPWLSWRCQLVLTLRLPQLQCSYSLAKYSMNLTADFGSVDHSENS